MNQSHLKEHLKNLHEESTSVHAADENSKKLIAKIQDYVRFLLAHKGDEPSDQHATIKEQLAESARHFDTTHPTFAATIRTVVSTLNTMGV